MQIVALDQLSAGDLVCLRAESSGETVLARWSFGCDAVGVAARDIQAGEHVEFDPEQSSRDILVKGSHGPLNQERIIVPAIADISAKDLVCLRHLQGGQIRIDKWTYGEEAVGVAARDINVGESVEFSYQESTDDILVKPGQAQP